MLKKSRIISLILAIALTTSVSVYTVNVKALSPADNTKIEQRLQGDNRYKTAIEVSKSGWEKSDNVILVTGENYADALCSVSLSKLLNAPILLTEASSLDKATEQEIARLKAKNVIIVGGEGVVSKDIQQKLQDNSLTTERIFGKDRFETSVNVAEKASKIAKEKGIEFGKNVVIVYGHNFADAISIASPAATLNMPIILVDSNSVPLNAKNFLTTTKPSGLYIIGGEGVIEESVKTEVDKLLNIKSVRIAGKDRYDTNVKVIQAFKDKLKFEKVYLATGAVYADALVGASLAAKNSAPLIIIEQSLSKEMEDIIKEKAKDVKNIVAIGGEGAISNDIIKDASVKLEEAKKAATSQTANSGISGGSSGGSSGSGSGSNTGKPEITEEKYGTNPAITVKGENVKLNYTLGENESFVNVMIYDSNKNVKCNDSALYEEVKKGNYNFTVVLDKGAYNANINITMSDGTVKKTNIGFNVK